MVPHEHRDQKRKDFLSQSLTGRASTSLGAARIRKGHHDVHANHAAQAAAETVAAAEAGPSRPDRNGQPRREGGAIGHKTHPRPALGHGEASARARSLGPGRLVPLDRNAKVRVMMVALALMPLFAEFFENIRTLDLAA